MTDSPSATETQWSSENPEPGWARRTEAARLFAVTGTEDEVETLDNRLRYWIGSGKLEAKTYEEGQNAPVFVRLDEVEERQSAFLGRQAKRAERKAKRQANHDTAPHTEVDDNEIIDAEIVDITDDGDSPSGASLDELGHIGLMAWTERIQSRLEDAHQEIGRVTRERDFYFNQAKALKGQSAHLSKRELRAQIAAIPLELPEAPAPDFDQQIPDAPLVEPGKVGFRERLFGRRRASSDRDATTPQPTGAASENGDQTDPAENRAAGD